MLGVILTKGSSHLHADGWVAHVLELVPEQLHPHESVPVQRSGVVGVQLNLFSVQALWFRIYDHL